MKTSTQVPRHQPTPPPPPTGVPEAGWRILCAVGLGVTLATGLYAASMDLGVGFGLMTLAGILGYSAIAIEILQSGGYDDC